MTEQQWDVIIGGAGPGGSIAAEYCAAAGLRTLLLEKDRDIGVPVRCGEGVPQEGLAEFCEPDPNWIASTIDQVRIYSPDENYFRLAMPGAGYILHRRSFDYYLATRAVKAGARVETGVAVSGVLQEAGRVTGVELEQGGRQSKLSCRLLIAADGVESRIARWAGIHTALPLKDLDSCQQVTLQGPDFNPGRVDFYFGNRIAPGGYAWVFPKGENSANVGLGISGKASVRRKAQAYLQDFLEAHFPEASILSTTVGGIPLDGSLKCPYGNGIMVVGDAAHQPNPVTGAGIINAMIAGKLAAATAAKALEQGDTSANVLAAYGKAWHKRVGWEHALYYKVRLLMENLNDETYNSVTGKLSGVPEPQRNLRKVLLTVFRNQPGFVLDLVMGLFSGRSKEA
ncbi:MAG: NAD(P)/FAD-dependent oxidoreductase [Candidatus Delongbacteria bacterium]|nr:NAD(P)/FAD-dependent oxidoreductase [Candidatus Delongbacteria bacterium]